MPSGTVTLLFTDIEGSTKLLEELGPEGYRDALAEHRRLLREVFARRGGYEVDYEGDAFFVAFSDAGEGVAAAQEAQSALAGGPISVRIGVHTGEPLLDPPKYVGRDVHLAARIMSAGHGGQTLLSHVTRALVDLETRDLGEHRLKDFAGPVSLFQLGPGAFPPLKTISNTNLPRPASSFVGREREVAEVVSLIRDGARLVTLTGPGGSGKTRLAIEAAAELVPEFKAGVFWVGLASLRDPALVPETVAETLGAKEELAAHVGEREMLLLLDNLEQVIEAAPELGALVETCPNLVLLVTSRERLRVRGEVEYEVLPLADVDAVALFWARAQVEPSPGVEELCRRLDNMPLALELAAARARVLTVDQILERLSHRLDLLTGGRDADPRQQTLRATIEWSYDLLAREEQELFDSLAVFAGGCTLKAAEEVCDAELDTLQSLVEKSLVRRTGDRFWMLETIREYANHRLEESGQIGELRRRHAAYVLALAEEAEPHLVAAGQREWLALLEAERDNIRAALGWAFEEAPALGLRVAAALGRFWWVRGAEEGLGWLERGLAAAAEPDEVRAAALDAAGGAAWFRADAEGALAFFEQGLAIYRDLGDRAGVARMLARLAPPLMQAGRLDEAARIASEAVEINRELGERGELALSLALVGATADEEGDLGRASALYEESMGLAREVGDTWQVVWDAHLLADLALRQGDLVRAWSLGCESLALARETGDDVAALICLGILSATAARRGDTACAGSLWGAAERLDGELGETLWRRDVPELSELLGERGPEFESARLDGLRLTIEEATEYVLSIDLPV
jgi:predicted ATPase